MLPTKRTKRNLNPLVSLQNDFSHFFENALTKPQWSDMSTVTDSMMDFSPNIDIKETEKEYKIEAELPGMDDENIDLSIENNCLIMKGEKRDEMKEDKDDYYHLERSFGSFYRCIPFSAEIDEQKVSAKYKSGVLNVTVAKSAKAVNSKRKITIQKN